MAVLPAGEQKEGEGEKQEEEEEEETGSASLSPARRVVFILSILFSLALCCVFLWGLPCDLATCRAPARAANATNATLEL